MKSILRLMVTFAVVSGAAYAPMSIESSLTPKTMATQDAKSLKLRADPSPKHRYDTLQNLVDHSSEIVIGVPISQSNYRRSPADRMIFTDYEVKVLETLKGDRHIGRSITLRLPGGFMSFEDGTTAEVRMPDFWKTPEIGKGYILFLRKSQNSPSKLVGGPQGVFEISPWPESFSMKATPDISTGRVVIPLVRDSDSLMKNYRGRDAGNLINEIKGMVGPFPTVGPSISKQLGRRARS